MLYRRKKTNINKNLKLTYKNKKLSCKVFQVGLKAYSNRYSLLYDSKISSYSQELFNQLSHRGLEVRMKGRLRGVRRARKMVLKQGPVSKNSFKKRLDCSNYELKTTTGILNLQVNIGR